MSVIKNSQTIIDSQSKNIGKNVDILLDVKYICESGTLITESLQRGSDVMQLPNGDIIVSELKPVTFLYTWDNVKSKLVRVTKSAKYHAHRN